MKTLMERMYYKALIIIMLLLCVACSKQLYRTDYQPADITYTNADLLRNFALIALRSEYSVSAQGTQRKPKSMLVSKWIKPVRYMVIDASSDDEIMIENLFKNLSELTQLDIKKADKTANMIITFADKSQRSAIVQNYENTGLTGAALWVLKRWRDRTQNPCIGMLSQPSAGGNINGAFVYIKDELKEPWRKLCIIEEIVQSFGLINDAPEARPSIFNDDQEFAELTEHDEYLLRILYSPEISPSMSAQEALPIAYKLIEKWRNPS